MPADQTPPAREPGRWEPAVPSEVWRCECNTRWNKAVAVCSDCATPRPPMPEAEPPRTVNQWGKLAEERAASPTGEGAPCSEGCAKAGACEMCVDLEDYRATQAISARTTKAHIETLRGSRPTGEGAEREALTHCGACGRAADPSDHLGGIAPMGDGSIGLCFLCIPGDEKYLIPKDADEESVLARVWLNEYCQPYADPQEFAERLMDWRARIEARAALRPSRPAPRETEPSEAMVEAALAATLTELRRESPELANNPSVVEMNRKYIRRILSAALRASNGGAERSTHAEGR